MPPFFYMFCDALHGLARCDPATSGILAEWLRRLIRNQLGTFPREFESLRCRFLPRVQLCHNKGRVHTVALFGRKTVGISGCRPPGCDPACRMCVPLGMYRSNAAAWLVEGCSRSRLWLPAGLERRLWVSWALTRVAPPQAGNGVGKTSRRG